MKNPTSQQVQTVIDHFERVLPQATLDNHLDMKEVKVKDGCYDCGTVHCHAGWYAVAKKAYFDKFDYHSFNYLDGIALMVDDLGFQNKYELCKWLRTRVGVTTWGNENSIDIFYKKEAFYHPKKRPEGAQNLQHIIDHWKEVKERLVQLESKNFAHA